MAPEVVATEEAEAPEDPEAVVLGAHIEVVEEAMKVVQVDIGVDIRLL